MKPPTGKKEHFFITSILFLSLGFVLTCMAVYNFVLHFSANLGLLKVPHLHLGPLHLHFCAPAVEMYPPPKRKCLGTHMKGSTFVCSVVEPHLEYPD